MAHTTGADNVRSMSPMARWMEMESESQSSTPASTPHTLLSPTLKPANHESLLISISLAKAAPTILTDTAHVAAAAGNGIVSRGEYIGTAPRAKILNLRVLNSKAPARCRTCSALSTG